MTVTSLPRTELSAPGIDDEAARTAVRDLLIALGEDPDSAHLRETPRRVAAAYRELLTPRPFTATTFPNDEAYDELVVARGIPFSSLCEHHLLPFVGTASVAYLPDAKILGLSKLARVVEQFARGLQVQERLTVQIADWLEDNLAPKGAGVVIEAEHMCMRIRGVRSASGSVVTSALRGRLREDAPSRAEFLAVAGITG